SFPCSRKHRRCRATESCHTAADTPSGLRPDCPARCRDTPKRCLPSVSSDSHPGSVVDGWRSGWLCPWTFVTSRMTLGCAIPSHLRDLVRDQATPGFQEKCQTISACTRSGLQGSRRELPERGVGLEEDNCGYWSHWDVAFTGSVSPVGPGQAPGLFRSRWTINSKRIHKIRQIAQLASSRVLPRLRGRFFSRPAATMLARPLLGYARAGRKTAL